MIIRLRRTPMKMLFPVVVLISLFASEVNCLAVMSVDLGSEWMKVAVVSPGVPMEIALNPESKRKTAVAVAFREGERTFGSDALGVGVKYPKNCYFYLLDLLGKKVDHPSVKLFQERFPYYTIEADPERGTVVFRHDEETLFSVEELVGMILSHAKDIAEDYTDQKLRDVVITVPVYFNQAERRALFDAAELASLNVLQLITEPMATALNYGMFRRKEINGTVKYMMFYDMGAYDTIATVVSYQIIKTKERGFSETHPQAQILGLGFDRNLGGLDLQIKLREYLADQFNALKKTKTDVRTVPRAMAKLFAEAGKVKNVLSANAAIYAQIENLMENIDVKIEVKREKFLELNADLFSRVTKPIETALQTSSITMDEISEVILMGAGTRVPRVQELLSEFLVSKGHKSNGELGKSINTDEASAMGAVYKAADLSTGFKVKKFITRDAVVFPIDVDFERHYSDEDSGSEQSKVVKRNVFIRMNQFPQKKVMTFNKHTKDFSFNVNYNDVDYLGPKEVISIGSLNLSKVQVKGVAEALEKNLAENVETKGVKAHFNFDESGILQVTSVESIFEKNITVAEQEAAEKKEGGDNSTETVGEEGGDMKDDTWAKLGDSISNFFGIKSGSNSDKKDENESETSEGDGKTGGDSKDEKKDNKKDKKSTKKTEEKKPKKEPKKPKIETIKEPLEFEVALTDLANMTAEQKKASKDKLDALNEHDKQKKARGIALNALESFVINTRDKLYQEIWEKSSTEEEREQIRAKLTEASDWIDEEATVDTELSILESKLKELIDLTAPLMARVREHTERPEALETLFKMINSSEYFIGKAKNSTSVVDGYFTQTELDNVEKKVADVKEWKEKAEKEQEAQPMHEMPKLTLSLIADKGIELDREVKYLINKAKIARAEKERERMKKEAEERAAQEEKKKAEEKAKKKKKKSKEAKAKEGDDETKQGENEETKEQEQKEETQEEENKETEEEPKQTQKEQAQKEDWEEQAEDKKETKSDDPLNIEDDGDENPETNPSLDEPETEEKDEEDIQDADETEGQTEEKEKHTEL